MTRSSTPRLGGIIGVHGRDLSSAVNAISGKW